MIRFVSIDTYLPREGTVSSGQRIPKVKEKSAHDKAKAQLYQ